MSTNMIALITIWRREVIRFIRIWPQTFLPPVITMSLYFIIFGNFIGQRVGQVSGYSYIQFIAPGLIMMSIITNAYGNVSASFFSAKFQHSIEELLVSPIPNYIILWGYIGGGIFRGLITGILVSLVAMYFAGLTLHNFIIAAGVMIFSSVLFSLAGLINAIFAKKFDDISIIPTFVLTPLTYLGGVFYSIELLPSFWRETSLANPIVYLINLFRYSLLGVSDVSIWLSLSMLVLFTVCAYGLSLWLLNRGVGIRT